MFWHIDTDIISLIVLASIYVCSIKLSFGEKPTKRDKCFMRCLESGIVITLIDIAASIIMEVPTPRVLFHIIMTMYFIGIEMIIVEWLFYVLTILYPEEAKGRKIIAIIALSVLVLYVLFNLTNPWTGYVFTLGENNEYSRGPFFFLMLGLFALYTLLLLSIILIRKRHVSKNLPVNVLLITPIIIAAGIFVQLSIPGWLMIIPANMLCLLLAFLFLQTVRVKTGIAKLQSLSKACESDPLTGLFNRTGMDIMVQKALDYSHGKRALVLIADIDDLKTINDTMGHLEGDRAIIMVAKTIKKHFHSEGTVVRYGGDEFLAFLIGNHTQEQFLSSLTKLKNELNTLKIGENDDFSLHGSIGAAFGIVGEDSFSELCHKADIALYHVKRSGKQSYAIYSDSMEEGRSCIDNP